MRIDSAPVSERLVIRPELMESAGITSYNSTGRLYFRCGGIQITSGLATIRSESYGYIGGQRSYVDLPPWPRGTSKPSDGEDDAAEWAILNKVAQSIGRLAQ